MSETLSGSCADGVAVVAAFDALVDRLVVGFTVVFSASAFFDPTAELAPPLRLNDVLTPVAGEKSSSLSNE